LTFSLAQFLKIRYILERGTEMAVKVKPVQPTEIKDKKIIREVIEHIHKPIPASVYRRNRELAELVEKMTRNQPSRPERVEVSPR